VFSVLESLRTRYAMLNFTDRAALCLETIEVSGHIEDWAVLCQLVFNCWVRISTKSLCIKSFLLSSRGQCQST
jgi:hypothetical protein